MRPTAATITWRLVVASAVASAVLVGCGTEDPETTPPPPPPETSSGTPSGSPSLTTEAGPAPGEGLVREFIVKFRASGSSAEAGRSRRQVLDAVSAEAGVGLREVSSLGTGAVLVAADESFDEQQQADLVDVFERHPDVVYAAPNSRMTAS